MSGVDPSGTPVPRTSALPGCRVATFETSITVPDAISTASVKHHRCAWAVTARASEYLRYHDNEWGVPVRDDRTLFEFLVLATAQAGLSWLTVLRKRDHYRRALANFNPVKVASFSREQQARLLEESGIVRNRRKLAAAVNNAQRFLAIQDSFGGFAAYLWDHVDGAPIQNNFRRAQDILPTTPLSDRISQDMKRRGFRFVGSKTVYAYLQAVGVVNDHLVGCFRYGSVRRLANSANPPPGTED